MIATGEAHSVRELVELPLPRPALIRQRHVAVDNRYFRPTEVDALLGDAAKARRILGWQPRVSFAELMRMMVAHDLDLARRERTVQQAGFTDAAPGAALAGGD